jgi:O-antigen/teichoic acid export membrane protein
VLGTVSAALGIAFYFVTRHTVLKGVHPASAIVGLATIPPALWVSFSASALLGRDRYEAYTALLVTQPIVYLPGGVGLALTFGVTGAVAGFAAATLAAAIVGWVSVRHAAGREPEPPRVYDSTANQLGRATRFGLQAWGANLLQLLNYRLDLFILSAVAARSAVGVYSVAVSLTALGWLLPDALQTVLFPRVASLDAAAEAGTIRGETSDASAARAIRHSVLMVIPIVIALAALVALVPLIYGARFQHAVSLGFILIPGVAVLGPGKVIAATISGRGFPRYALYVTLITLPVTLALYLVLIPSYHATGAAVASTISYGLSVALSVVALRRVTNISLRAALLPTRADLADYTDAIRLARSRVLARLRSPVSG